MSSVLMFRSACYASRQRLGHVLPLTEWSRRFMNEIEPLKLGVEVGGTFTDLVLVRGDRVAATVKVASTTPDPSLGVMDAIEQAKIDLRDVEVVVHGSTVATNTVLERSGPPTGLIATEGFRDILEIYPEERTEIYNIHYQKPLPLVSRDLVVTASERITADGQVLLSLDTQNLALALDYLINVRNVKSIAVSLLHSYKNAVHEQEVERLFSATSGSDEVKLSLSSNILPEFREYPRTSTTVLNAYVQPTVNNYLSSLGSQLEDGDFGGHLHIFSSNGGLLPADAARRQAARTLLSGPAAGVAGAIHVAARSDLHNIITFDMGGTSTDVCLVTDGKPEVTSEGKLGGYAVALPMVDISSVGAGGGSIAWLDAGRMLRVGPRSAGAHPGPASYGRGGTAPTVTDANVVKGLLRDSRTMGGGLSLSSEAAALALQGLSMELEKPASELADGILDVANTLMAQAIRLVTVERGRNPSNYTLFAYGGAGPLHAAAIAETLRIPRVVIPESPGVLSAYGLLVAPFKWDFVRTVFVPLVADSLPRLRSSLNELLEQSARETEGTLEASHLPAVHRYTADLRYQGQSYELAIPIQPDELQPEMVPALVQRFNAVHEMRYGFAMQEDIDVVNVRLVVQAERAAPIAAARADAPAAPPIRAAISTRGNSELIVDFHWRDNLASGARLRGPTIVEEATATTYIPPYWTATVDRNRNLVLEREES